MWKAQTHHPRLNGNTFLHNKMWGITPKRVFHKQTLFRSTVDTRLRYSSASNRMLWRRTRPLFKQVPYIVLQCACNDRPAKPGGAPPQWKCCWTFIPSINVHREISCSPRKRCFVKMCVGIVKHWKHTVPRMHTSTRFQKTYLTHTRSRRLVGDNRFIRIILLTNVIDIHSLPAVV